jgi:hypothetical protein
MDFATAFEACYPAVQNEMYMRESAGQINGRFIRDDQPWGDGWLRSVAWIIMTKEQTVLQFPETYGRKVIVTMVNLWDEPIATFSKPGYYGLSVPGEKVARLLAKIEVHPESESDWIMALDLQDTLSIVDIGVGADEYEDSQALVSTSEDLVSVDIAKMTAKEFFAIASTIVHYNPPRDKKLADKLRATLRRTETARPSDLEAARIKALGRLGIEPL